MRELQVLQILGKENIQLPVVLSSPHSGVHIPEEIKTHFKAEMCDDLEDTDWSVDQLYCFVVDMGIPLISAQNSRWVVDLNRDPDGNSLYQDGRAETSIVPLFSFSGRPIYHSGKEPDADEVERRVQKYFIPYHQYLRELLRQVRDQFGVALLFEAHSIKRSVPSIQKDPFPDLIVGTQDGRTLPSDILNKSMEVLTEGGYEATQNQPFKGGFLTRSMAIPEKNIFSVQLEMSQDLYLAENNTQISQSKCQQLQPVLKRFILQLASGVQSLL